MKTKLLIATYFAFLSAIAFAQPGSLDLTYTPGSGANARIRDTKIHTDGNTIIGGLFSEYQSWFYDASFQLLESNANRNASFNATGLGGQFHEVRCIDQLSDGSFILGGSLYNYNSTSVAYSYLAKTSTSGANEFTFNAPLLLNGDVYAVDVQSDNKIVYGAYYVDPLNTTIPLYKLERLNSTNGSVDATFNVGTGPNDIVEAIAIQADGKIIIGGRFTSYNGTAKNYIARINSNGSIDNTFNVGTGFNNFSQIKNIQIQSDGKVIVVGEFTSYNGTARSGIVRINTNGSIDATFNPGTGAMAVSSSGVYDVAIQSDGKIIIVGDFSSYNGTNISRIARINSDGTLDTSFDSGTGPNNTVHSVSIQSDGKVIIAGDFTSYNGTTRNRVARLLSCAPPTITGTTPDSRCGTGTVTLGAAASAGTINWYAASTGGASLGTGTSFDTPSISSSTTYYVDATNGGCTTASRTAVTATVNTAPTITGTTPNSRCGTGTVTLGAAVSAGTINWYAASTGGASLGTGTSFVTPSISSNTTYYVDATNGGCTTASRTTVTATVNTAPTITGTTPNSRCGTGTVTLGAAASAGTINWYAASTGGASLGTGTSFVTQSISSNTTYYVDATNGGCTTASRTAVTATVNTAPTITGTTPNSRCGIGTVTLGAAASAGTINWYAASTGGASLGTGTSFVTPSISSNTTYYVDATNGGCTTASRTAVIATVNNVPAQPSAISGTLTACQGTTQPYVVTSEVGVTYDWIASGGSISGTGNSVSITWNNTGLQPVSVTAVNGCGSSSASTINVTVNSGSALAQPGVISGNISICESTSNVYSISDVVGASSYTWTLPSGWSGTSVTNSINTTAGTNGGVISVSANNSCGSSSAQTLNVVVNTLPTVTIDQTGNTLTVQESGLVYQWVDCDNSFSPISGEFGQSFVAPANGNYAVEVSENGCTTFSNCVNVSIAGLDEVSNNSFKIYPNPIIDGSFTITSNELISSVMMYDALGKVVFEESLYSLTKIEINLPQLKSGFYMLRMNNETQRILVK